MTHMPEPFNNPGEVRVLLATFRRSHLLPRALESLRQQTFTRWVCEVHNDDPDDTAPAEIVHAVGDRRIVYVPHRENWGLTRTLNAVFDDGPEPFVALLEDDNWWEPGLLEKLLKALHAEPEADVAWSNMRLWREEPDGTWTNLQQTTWPVPPTPGVQRFTWPQKVHVTGHLHSNGAALIRRRQHARYRIPTGVVAGSTEAIRERAFAFPLLLIEEPLANFAITRRTARPKGRIAFFQQQVLLAATFFRHVAPIEPLASAIWNEARHGSARSTHVLVIAWMLSRTRNKWRRFISPQDWLWFAAWAIRHPLDCFRALRSLHELPELWSYLDRNTRRKSTLAHATSQASIV